tara:strand:- start:27 stop:578 length:552 start_codon:yes stop_codon:yes gene_type:complete
MPDADPAIEIDIRIEAAGWRAMTTPAPDVAEQAVRAALDYTRTGGTALELSLLLTDDTAIAALNEQWRGKAGPTNVLSFPGNAPAVDGGSGGSDNMPGDAPVLLGDIVIAFETLTAEADAAGISPTDHLCHLCVHGVLHLLGYDHENDEDAAEMESCEIEILGTLGVSDPYAAADRRLERAAR